MAKIKNISELSKEIETFGFISIPRIIIKTLPPNYLKVFELLVSGAKFKDTKTLKRGQCSFTISEICTETDFTPREIRTILTNLSDAGYISISSTVLKYSIATITDYDIYSKPTKEVGKNDKATDKGNPLQTVACSEIPTKQATKQLKKSDKSYKNDSFCKNESSSTTTAKKASKAKINDATYALFLKFEKEAISRGFLKFVSTNLQEPIETFFEIKPDVEELFKYIDYRIEYFMRKNRIDREDAIRCALTGLMDSYDEYCKDLVSSW